MSQMGLGCVKTRVSLKRAELFSQFASSDGYGQMQCSFGAAKSKRTFCDKIEFASFHTAWSKTDFDPRLGVPTKKPHRILRFD